MGEDRADRTHQGAAGRDGGRAVPSAAVVGSGIAGLFAALRLADEGWDVTVVTKARLADSSTNWAQGGIAGILDATDAEGIEAHIEDTLEAGAGLADAAIVRHVVTSASERLRDLIARGVSFDRDGSGAFDLAREGGHAHKRILHARDATGAEIERALVQGLRGRVNVTVLEGCLAVDLILRERHALERSVVGLWALDLLDGRVTTTAAEVILVATGGAGQLFGRTTNPAVSTGDGLAMVVRAGAAVRDLEFVQFHPTALVLPGTRPFLITEALRGHGAVLMTPKGHRHWTKAREAAAIEGWTPPDAEAASFMRRHDRRGSLATRDVVARAADSEMKHGGAGHVLLVTEHLDADELEQRFPTIAAHCASHGLRLGHDPLPVGPAAHYLVGGLATDIDARVLQARDPEWSTVATLADDVIETIPRIDGPSGVTRTLTDGHPIGGLYAIGEVACTGLHGANRLASNSLLEAIVFAHRAVDHALSHPPVPPPEGPLPAWRADGLAALGEHAPLVSDRETLRSTMTHDVGLLRRDRRLTRALRRLRHLHQETERLWRTCLPSRELCELRNLIVTGDLVARAALARRHNVGLHWNEDLV